MHPNDVDAVDAHFSALLEIFDQELAAGGQVGPLSLPQDTAAIVAERLARARACLERLERRRRRAHSLTPPLGGLFLSFDRSPATAHFGRFQLIRELGRGGSGVVLLAFDTLLRREIALKVPRPEVLVDEGLRRRFLQEAQAAARLDHPNLVPVYDAGEAGPFCYIVSAYCRGPTLAAWLQERTEPVPVRLAAQLMVALASAVAYIHGCGIIHRDIKPGNVMLESNLQTDGELVVRAAGGAGELLDLVPRLTDFGLAKLSEGTTQHTRSGVILGTPAYMAPEQAEGRLTDIGPATDVYALGVVLYELLTGRPPFLGKTDLDTFQQVVSGGPVPPRRLRPDVPRDLETICLKCLDKEPAERYPSGVELGQELGRFLTGIPIQGRRRGWGRRFLDRLRRKPRSLLGSLLASSALLLCLLLAYLLAREQEDNRARQGEATQNEAERAASLSRTRYVSHIQAAAQWLRSGYTGAALHVLQQARSSAEDAPGFEWRLLHRLAHHGQIYAASAGVFAVSLSPDGRTFATVMNDGAVQVWDRLAGRARVTLAGHPRSAFAVAFSSDGTILALSSGRDQNGSADVKLWEVRTGALLAVAGPFPGPVDAIAFSTDDQLLAVGGRLSGAPGEGQVSVWDRRRKEIRAVLPVDGGAGGQATALAFSPDGEELAIAWSNPSVEVWNIGQARREGISTAHTGPVVALAFAPDGKGVVSGGLDGAFRLWNLGSSPEHVVLFQKQPGFVRAVAYSPDGRRVACGTEDGFVLIYEPRSGRLQARLRAHNHRVRSLSFSRDSGSLASASDDATVKLWDPREITLPVRCSGHGPAEAWSVAFSPDGRILASAGDDQHIRLWDLATHQETNVLKGHTSLVTSIAFTPDGRTLASVSYDGTAKLWDTTTGRERGILRCRAKRPRCLAICPAGRRLAIEGNGNTLQLWNLQSGREERSLAGHLDDLRAVVFTPDGKSVASGGHDASIRIWDVETGSLRLCLYDSTEVWSLAFSPDGRTLASGNKAGLLRLWDPATGEERGRVFGHPEGVKSVRFTPDGKTLASASADYTIKLWHAASGVELLTLRDHQGQVNALAFSPDGRALGSASHDGSVRLWLTAGDPPAVKQGRPGE